MLALPPDLVTAISTRHGVVTRDQLRLAEVSDDRIYRLLRSGALERLRPGVFGVAGAPRTELREWVALCAWLPKSAMSYSAAVHLWVLRGLGNWGCEITVPTSRRVTAPGVVVHRALELSASDVLERPDGIRVTTPARTLFDMASVVDGPALESMLEQGLHEKLFTLDGLRTLADRLGQRGRPGSTAFSELVNARAAWQAPAESGLEVRFLQALRRGGLPEPVRQLPVVLPNGQRIRVDFAYPQWRIAMEVDGFGHTGPTASVRDQRRDRAMSELGWITLRFGRNDIWPDAQAAVAVVRRHVEARPRVPGSKVEKYAR